MYTSVLISLIWVFQIYYKHGDNKKKVMTMLNSNKVAMATSSTSASTKLLSMVRELNFTTTEWADKYGQDILNTTSTSFPTSFYGVSWKTVLLGPSSLMVWLLILNVGKPILSRRGICLIKITVSLLKTRKKYLGNNNYSSLFIE